MKVEEAVEMVKEVMLRNRIEGVRQEVSLGPKCEACYFEEIRCAPRT